MKKAYVHHSIKCSVLALLLVLPTGGVVAKQAQSKVEISEVKVGKSIHVLYGMGGNIGVSIGEDGILLIDDQYEALIDPIQKALAKLTKQPIRFVINTHWHGDHVGGNSKLKSAGATIVAHENVRQRMSKAGYYGVIDQKVDPSPASALPIITYSSKMTIHFNGDEIDLLHVQPSHSDGDTIVFFRQSNVIHTGDLFFNGLYPYIDVVNGGSIDGMIAVVQRVLSMVDMNTVIIPGHGPVADKQALKDYLTMLKTVRDRVKALIDKKKSLAQVIAAKPSLRFDEKWGKSFLTPSQFTELIYRSFIK